MASATIMAPLFHELFPDRQFMEKPKLRQITQLLSVIRLAYPSFRKDLQDATAASEHDHHRLTHLQNVIYLCEYFIPVVRPDCRKGWHVHVVRMHVSASNVYLILRAAC